MIKELLKDLKVFSLLLLLSIFLIIFDNLKLFNLPKALIQTITSPIQYGLYQSSLGVSKQFSFVFLVRRTAQEKKALEEQLAQVLSENANLRKKLAEQEAFVVQQGALNPQNFTLLAARPVGIARYLYIDRGEDDGIKLNQIVIYKDSMIGKIFSVSPKKSMVILLTDPDSHIAAFSESSDGRARGVLSGEFGSEMVFDKILHQEAIKVGDLVYSEGTEVDLPRGLVLGQVAEVIDQDNETFKRAKVKTVFDVTNLDVVFVILN